MIVKNGVQRFRLQNESLFKSDDVEKAKMTEGISRSESPLPPSPEEARRALEEGLAEAGIVFSKRPPLVKLEAHVTNVPVTFIDDHQFVKRTDISGCENAYTSSCDFLTKENLSENGRGENGRTRPGERKSPQKYWSADPRRGHGLHPETDDLGIGF